MEKLFVTYLRVSTVRQGASGLGLEAQRASVLAYIQHNGNRIIREFIEVESGRNNNRPELLKAIEFAKEKDATLCVAKLDRLSRDVAFTSALMQSKVKFVCADMPEANSLTLHIISAIAEYERQLISERTKRALQAKRERSPLWKAGTNNLNEAGRKKSQKVIHENAMNNTANRHAFHFIKPLRDNGRTYEEIANLLNKEGYKTRTGKHFNKMLVRHIYLKFANDGPAKD